MYSRLALLTPEDAEKYRIISVSRSLSKPGLYFASLNALGLPKVVIKLEYRIHGYCTDNLYTVSEIRDGKHGVVHIENYYVKKILKGKVKLLLEKFKEVDCEAIKKETEGKC